MTDRYNAFIVILEKDIRDDDAKETIAAIKQIKGVLEVKPQLAGIDEMIARERVKQELAEKLFKVIWGERKPT